MTTGTLITNNGKKIAMTRVYTANGSLSATQYLTPTKFKVGIDQSDITTADTDITRPVPISYGTICDNGANSMTGTNGGTTTTNNVTTYKIGGGETDNTSQNLLTTGLNTTKTWRVLDLSSVGSNATATYYTGLWLYIKDATTLAKFLSSGTALKIMVGTDTSNYYYKNYTAASLAVGWNWLELGILNTNSVYGVPTATLSTFLIEIYTNNAADAFIAGDVLYDLLRQWQTTDLVKSFVSGYPSINYSNYEVTSRCYLNLLEANGFNITGFGTFNEDATPLIHTTAKTSSQSKSDTDEFAFVIRDRWV